jgi:catechol 2,3-dioxygenase-like lactoylglutathione lyase family enzyme
MTINHVMMRVSKANLETLRSFYVAVLEPLGYKEMMRKGDLIAFGSDFPYFWLQGTPDDQKPLPLHVALDAPS